MIDAKGFGDAIQSVHDPKVTSTIASLCKFSSLAGSRSGRCGFLARLLRLGSKRRELDIADALYINLS